MPNPVVYVGFRQTTGDASRVPSVGAILVPTRARDLHFASAADENTDWNVENPDNPVLYIHSETTPATDYGTFDHDATDFIMRSFGGGIRLVPVGDVQIDNTFGLIIGSATQVTLSDGDGATDMAPELQVLGTAAVDGSLVVAVFNITNTRAVSPHIALLKGAAATQVATTAVADNEVVGSIIAYGSDGGDFETPVGAIEFVVDDPGGPGASAIGGSIEFYTTADGGTTLTLAITIDTAQNTIVADGNGVVIGDATQRAVAAVTPEFQVHGTAGADSTVLLARWSADITPPTLYFGKARGAIGTFTIVVTGDVLGSIEGFGSDGVDFNSNANASAAIRFQSSGTIAADRVPGEIRVLTATDAAPSVLTESFRVGNDQNIYVLDGNGLIIGRTTTVAIDSTTAEFEMQGTAAADSTVGLSRWSADVVGPRLDMAKSRSATIGTFSIITSGDILGELRAWGDDGVDFASNAGNPSAVIRFQSSGTIAADRVPGEIIFLTATDAAPSVLTSRMTLNNAGILQFASGSSIAAGSATEIAISVTNDAVTVGSEGTMIAPFLSSADTLFTDALGGNVDGAFAFLRSSVGPTSTLEARVLGAWLSVAIAGYLHQNRIPWVEDSTFLYHPDQLIREDGRLWLDESLCFVCGEPMLPGEQLTFWANGRYERGTHSIFGHTHLELDPVVKQLQDRIEELEAAVEAQRLVRA